MRRGDLVGDLPAVADVMQHDLEAEFLRQSQHGEDVVVTVRVKMHDPSCRRALRPGLPFQIARRAFSRHRPRALRILSRYSSALTYCSRTSAADLARVPGNGGWRRELVPLAIFIPPAMRAVGVGE